jgi:hypothetical protein
VANSLKTGHEGTKSRRFHKVNFKNARPCVTSVIT